MKLPVLTAAEITAALAPKKRHRNNSKNYYYVRDGENIVRVSGKPPADTVGSFYGNVGSVTRSRKGAIRRKANGFRRYDGIGEIVGYKVTP